MLATSCDSRRRRDPPVFVRRSVRKFRHPDEATQLAPFAFPLVTGHPCLGIDTMGKCSRRRSGVAAPARVAPMLMAQRTMAGSAVVTPAMSRASSSTPRRTRASGRDRRRRGATPAGSPAVELATVPAHPGCQHAGGRLLPRRLRAHPAANLRPVRDRSQQPLPARAGRDGPSRWTVDHSAGSQPADGISASTPPGFGSSSATAPGSSQLRSTRSWRTRASRWSKSRRGVRVRTASPNASS